MTQDLLSGKAGKNLKKLIKLNGYTQEKFAIEKLHVDPVTLRRWIAYGIKDVNIINEIAMIFDIDFIELFK